MISQAYIFGSLGKAAFKEDEKWYVLDNNDPNTIRDWHTFDKNYLALTNPEIVAVPEGQSIDDLRQLLALETTKQEALTLALQLMDESIPEEALKAEIAELLGEYTQDAAIFQFLENRLLTTIVSDSFDPSFAANVCRSVQMNAVAGIYELLDTHAREIQTFYTAWLKIAKHHFQNAEMIDNAFGLLTSQGIAKIFVQSIAQQNKALWDKAVLNATLLLQKEKFISNALVFNQLRTSLVQDFQVTFKEKLFSDVAETIEKDDIADLIEAYLDQSFDKKITRKRTFHQGKKTSHAVWETAQSNVEYAFNEILGSLRDGRHTDARFTVFNFIKQQAQTSAPEHICKSLTNIAGFLLSNGVIDFTKTLLEYAKILNSNDLVVDTLGAEVLKAEGKIPEAKEAYLRIKKQFPNDPVAQKGYANVLKEEGNLLEAKTEYKRILIQFPNDVYAQNGYAEVLKAQGKISEAKAYYLRIKHQFPNDVVAQNGYAGILKAEGNLAEAKTEYLRIKKQFPDNVVAQTGYAEILKAEGNLAEGKIEYLRIKKQFPNDVVAQNGYAEILKAEGNLTEAKTEYLRIKKQFPDNIVAQTGYAEILKAGGNLAEAKTEYLRIKKQFPNDVVAQNGYAEILKAEGNLAEVKTGYLRIKKQFPDNVVAQTGYAEILKAEGNLVEAKTEYLRIKKQFPDNVVAQTGYAEILKAEGNLTEAKTEYQRILKLRPDNQIVLHALNSLLLVLGESTVNLPAVPIHPYTIDDFYWLYFHITKLIKEGDWIEAKRLSLLGINTCNFYDLKIRFKRTKKYVSLQVRDFESAIADLNDYLENQPIDHVLQTHAYAELNQMESARFELKKTIQFKGIPIIYDTACLLSEKYSINGLPKSNLPAEELTKRIREYEYQALVLA